MIEKRGLSRLIPHFILLVGLIIVCFPIYVALVASTVTQQDIVHPPIPLLPGPYLVDNYTQALFGSDGLSGRPPVWSMLFNSTVMALGITIGKIVISIISAYAIVYFRFPFRRLSFWLVFMTLMLPVEVRILPTYKVAADFGLLNSYGGLILPLIASATATFLFRQFFLTVPDELAEAARVDGAGPIRFFLDILLPLSRTNIAALFVILFIYGWNQYLWPLIITTKPELTTAVVGISQMISPSDDFTVWPVVMATTILTMLPPVLVVIIMQRQFIKGLIETEK